MIAEFSAKTGVPVEDILGRSRVAYIAEAREMYYYLLLLNKFHVSEIAGLADRKHGTVIILSSFIICEINIIFSRKTSGNAKATHIRKRFAGIAKRTLQSTASRVMLKTEAVYLKGLGLKNGLACKITGVCGNALREYLKQYIDGGIEGLKEVSFYRPGSD